MGAIFLLALPITRGDRGDELPHARPRKELYGSQSTSGGQCPGRLTQIPPKHM